MCCNLSTSASCPVSLLSTTLPCTSYATCSFHSAVGSVHQDCRVLLSTPSTSVSHSRLHLCLVPVMPRVLSTPAVGSVHPDCLVFLCTPSSSNAVSHFSLPSTPLPCPSHTTCSFHSAVGHVQPDCLLLLSTPPSSNAVSHSSLLSTPLPCLSHATCSFLSSCWPCSARPGLVLLSTPPSSHAVSHFSLPSTPLPCPSHTTCSFLSSCWPCSARLSCALTCPDRLTGSVHRPAGSALCRCSPGEMTAGRAQWLSLIHI